MGDEEDLLDEEMDDEVLSGGSMGSSRSKLVTILLWVGGAFAMVLITFLIAYMVAKHVRSQSYKEDQNIVIAPAPPPLAVFTFPNEFRVNTADVDEPHFIQLKMALGYDEKNKNLETELIQRQIQLMHIINIILGGKKKEDLATPLQKLNLSEEIKSQINMIISSGKIDEVFFKQLVIS